MSEAILATLVDVKIIRTRSQMQIICEIPIEQADHALKMLGGIPQPGTERWVGIALAPKERKEAAKAEGRKLGPFKDLPLSKQAGIHCHDKTFIDFLTETYVTLPEDFDPAVVVRDICHIFSRSELDTNDLAAAKWRKLEEDFQAYKTDLRYAGTARL